MLKTSSRTASYQLVELVCRRQVVLNNNMQFSLIGVVLAILVAGTGAQTQLNVTGCVTPCNLATKKVDVLIFIDGSKGMGDSNIALVSRCINTINVHLLLCFRLKMR